MRQTRELFVILLVLLVGDDGHTFGHEPPQPARMVKVVVRVDHIFDRLIGNQLLCLGDDRGGAGLTVASFDQNNVILEVHGDAGVSAKNEVHAVAKLA